MDPRVPAPPFNGCFVFDLPNSHMGFFILYFKCNIFFALFNLFATQYEVNIAQSTELFSVQHSPFIILGCICRLWL